MLHSFVDQQAPNGHFEQQNMLPQQQQIMQPQQQQQVRATNGHVNTSNICLPVAAVRASKNGREVATYAFLDGGSTATFCSESLVRRLGIGNARETSFNLTTLSQSDETVKCKVVDLDVISLDYKGPQVQLRNVFVVPSIPVSQSEIFQPRDVQRWAHLSHLKLPALQSDVDLLIGNNYGQALEPLEVIKGGQTGVYAVRTILGWVVNGPISPGYGRHVSSNFVRTDSLQVEFEKFCNREFEDIACEDEKMSVEDERAMSIMQSTINQQSDRHYEVALPWKEDDMKLPDNKPLALHRLGLLKKRLQKDGSLGLYSEYMEELLRMDYIEVCDPNAPTGDRTWYLPHHPVYNPHKPGRVRVVFDCSAKFRNISLNDALLKGPNLANPLTGVLLRFRQGPVGVMGDIKGMFHQVRVPVADRDALRFLWWPNHDVSLEPIAFRFKVHLFGAISSPSICNYALQQTALRNQQAFSSDVVETIANNFYVDDCLKSVETPGDGIALVKDVTSLLESGGFHITKWLSNSREVLDSMSENERAPCVKDLGANDILPKERALGVLWNTETDTFGFQSMARKQYPVTRRSILSLVCSIYDPLGLISPCVLPGRILLQDLCRQGIGWDDALSDGDHKLWLEWLNSILHLDSFAIPRCIKPVFFGKIQSLQIHHFSDASEKGYGVASYVRITDDNGSIHTTLLLAKSRVTPLKTVSIPRLELQAATLAVRVNNMIHRELDLHIDSSTFWTDSTAVLKYIWNKDRRFKTFVANRLATIHASTLPDQWRFVPGKLNPGDDASRGQTIDRFLANTRWIQGPEFLRDDETAWPKNNHSITGVEVSDPEVKVEKAFVQTCNSDMIAEMATRYSSWTKFKRVLAWMIRFTDRLKKRKSHGDDSLLTVDEIECAEHFILMSVQRKHFPQERNALANGDIVRKSSKIFGLDPILQDGLLKVGGRIGKSKFSNELKHQIIIPKEDPVATLLIRHLHETQGHMGRNYVLSSLRAKFWVTHGNAAVRKVLADCVKCRRRKASNQEQKMGDVPLDRLMVDKPPFSSTGVDYFGPFLVKRARSRVKMYGCLFTCLTSRAVHIEVASSLDSDSFINALRRFIARRGTPEIIRSDNGTNFIAGERELRQAIEAWNQEQIHDYLTQKNIKWIFNPPTGSHWGGIWERCIRSVRAVLSALVEQQTLDAEGLSTVMCEVESLLNNRPITSISSDPKDLEALSPNHLLLLRSCVTMPPGVFCQHDNYVRRRWRQVQYMVDLFWRRWVREYVPLLQTRNKWCQTRKNLKIGDIVLLVDYNAPRGYWPLAQVINVFPGSDGLVRKVRVRTQSSVFDRPISKCVLLEGST